MLAAVLLAALACLVGPAFPAAAASAPASPSPAPGDVVGMPLPEAEAALQLLKIPFSTDPSQLPAGTVPERVLVMQEPPDPGLARNGVFLVLGSRVPSLVGRTVSDAARTLAALGLVGQRVPSGAPDGAVVVGQNVPAEYLLALGQAVQVSPPPPQPPAPSPAPSSLTPPSPAASAAPGAVVPDVRGEGLGAARDAIESAGLAITGTVAGHGAELTAVGQRPSAGATVRPGTLVHVAFLATVSGVQQDSTSRWAGGLAVTLALATGAAVVLQLRRMRVDRQRSWARQHVRARLRAGALPTGRVSEPGPVPGPTIVLEPHLRLGTRTLIELPR